jgi:hypothetical protein
VPLFVDNVIIGNPELGAVATMVEVLHVFKVVLDKQHFVILFPLCATRVWTRNVIHPWQCFIVLEVLANVLFVVHVVVDVIVVKDAFTLVICRTHFLIITVLAKVHLLFIIIQLYIQEVIA